MHLRHAPGVARTVPVALAACSPALDWREVRLDRVR